MKTYKERATKLNFPDTSVDLQAGIEFAAIILYDGQSFMGYRTPGVETLADLKQAVVCVQKGTTTEDNLKAFIRARALPWTVLVVQSDEGANEALMRGRCTLQTNDRSFLVGWRALSGGENLQLFPEVISKEPLSAAVRPDDTQWLKIVRWVIYALISAEETGVSQANVQTLAAGGAEPAQEPLLGKAVGGGASGRW